ncbi:hypothetical protein [Flavobacterium sp.]|uniref:hypothetical protein n=1 Tax=Flavobacterium sp. TaxID=239 RepID=UPI0026068BF3|nr:hypothetical protein [Flavobacterium sp.]
MKKFLFALSFMFSFAFLTSCSVDELDENQNLNSKLSYIPDNVASTTQNDNSLVMRDSTRVQTTVVVGSEIDPPKPAPKPE